MSGRVCMGWVRMHLMGPHAPHAFSLAWIITPDEGMQPQLLVDAAWLRAARHGTRLCSGSAAGSMAAPAAYLITWIRPRI